MDLRHTGVDRDVAALNGVGLTWSAAETTPWMLLDVCFGVSGRRDIDQCLSPQFSCRLGRRESGGADMLWIYSKYTWMRSLIDGILIFSNSGYVRIFVMSYAECCDNVLIVRFRLLV